MESIGNTLAQAISFLKKEGFQEDTRLEAELLLAYLLKCERLQLYLRNHEPVSLEIQEAYQKLLKKRSDFYPVAYLLGKWDFYGFSFLVSPEALIPRPETERLVEFALPLLKNQLGDLLDIGTGTGCIALSLLALLPKLQADLVDCSSSALALARENALRLEVLQRASLYEGSLFAPLPSKKYRLIVSNPPYIDPADYETLQAEVRLFEPKHALIAEEKGEALLRDILKQAPAYLLKGGSLLIEMGQNQWKSLLPFARSCGYHSIELRKDFAGIERFLCCTTA